MGKTLVLLLNVGTPDKPDKKSVAKYLVQFLSDKYIINLPWFFRKFLVCFIIVPFRTPKSVNRYKSLWNEHGSPLLYHLNNLSSKLQEKIGDDYLVMGAMRYGNPSVISVFKRIKNENIEKIIVVPLYPQYATSTTESAKQHVLQTIKKSGKTYDVTFLEQFYNHQAFIETFANQIETYNPKNFDHIVFSFHGIPVVQVENLHPEIKENVCTCAEKMPEHGTRCYKATCYETSRLLATKLSISREKYDVAFQSRLGFNWLQPYLDKMLLDLLIKGKKKILVISPSFVADCLETNVEIKNEFANMFVQNGGSKLVVVKSLNDDDNWVETLLKIILESKNK